jgi:hypothetical protein
MSLENLSRMIRTTNIAFNQTDLIIDGVHIALENIPQFLYELTHPNPKRWYRLERVGDVIVVHVRMAVETEEKNGYGYPIASIGSSREDSGVGR